MIRKAVIVALVLAELVTFVLWSGLWPGIVYLHPRQPFVNIVAADGRLHLQASEFDIDLPKWVDNALTVTPRIATPIVATGRPPYVVLDESGSVKVRPTVGLEVPENLMPPFKSTPTLNVWQTGTASWITTTPVVYRTFSFAGLAVEFVPDRFTGSGNRIGVNMTLPLWMPLLLFGMPLGMLLARGPLRRWSRRRRGLCLTCGYNLEGNTSGTCPECGGKIDGKS